MDNVQPPFRPAGGNTPPSVLPDSRRARKPKEIKDYGELRQRAVPTTAKTPAKAAPPPANGATPQTQQPQTAKKRENYMQSVHVSRLRALLESRGWKGGDNPPDKKVRLAIVGASSTLYRTDASAAARAASFGRSFGSCWNCLGANFGCCAHSNRAV